MIYLISKWNYWRNTELYHILLYLCPMVFPMRGNWITWLPYFLDKHSNQLGSAQIALQCLLRDNPLSDMTSYLAKAGFWNSLWKNTREITRHLKDRKELPQGGLSPSSWEESKDEQEPYWDCSRQMYSFLPGWERHYCLLKPHPPACFVQWCYFSLLIHPPELLSSRATGCCEGCLLSRAMRNPWGYDSMILWQFLKSTTIHLTYLNQVKIPIYSFETLFLLHIMRGIFLKICTTLSNWAVFPTLKFIHLHKL